MELQAKEKVAGEWKYLPRSTDLLFNADCRLQMLASTAKCDAQAWGWSGLVRIHHRMEKAASARKSLMNLRIAGWEQVFSNV